MQNLGSTCNQKKSNFRRTELKIWQNTYRYENTILKCVVGFRSLPSPSRLLMSFLYMYSHLLIFIYIYCLAAWSCLQWLLGPKLLIWHLHSLSFIHVCNSKGVKHDMLIYMHLSKLSCKFFMKKILKDNYSLRTKAE